MWSTAYWLAVAVGTVAFAMDVEEVYNHRQHARFFPEALVLYVSAVLVWCGFAPLIVILARSINPKTHFFAGTPTAVIAGATIVFLGGHALAGVWDSIWHREPTPSYKHALSPQDLAAAEAYDDQWQAQFRTARRPPPRFADWHVEYLRRRRERRAARSEKT